MEDLRLPENVKYILDKLNAAGFEAYVVGGCVRDELIGRPVHDWDIATSAYPNQVSEVFSDYTIIPTGIKHGTVTVVLNGGEYEITTYRIDGEYKDHRHPKAVKFTGSLIDDLKRRDFTINAMAYSPKTGLIDYFGGKEDIDCGIIRCVGNPNKRFKEDALRILRAIRFSTILNYKIAGDTLDALLKNRGLLKDISKERIQSELIKTLSAGAPTCLIYVLQPVIGYTMSEIIEHNNRLWHTHDLYSRLAAVFDCGDSDATRKLMRKFRFDNKIIKNVLDICHIVNNISIFCNPPIVDREAAKLMLNHNPDIVESTMDYLKSTVCLADEEWKIRFADNILKVLPQCKQECYRISQLEVDGNDMISLGFKDRAIGAVLKELLFAVIAGKVENRHDALMDYAKKF